MGVKMPEIIKGDMGGAVFFDVQFNDGKLQVILNIDLAKAIPGSIDDVVLGFLEKAFSK